MKYILILALSFILTSPAYAGKACYSAKEVTAEKVLRLHSELMVITVTCKQGSTGRDLVRAYSQLTKTHIKPIKRSEQILAAFYAKNKGGSGIAHLDKLRTKLANTYGQIVAEESAAAFCARRRDIVTRLYDSRRLSFERESLRANSHIELLSPSCQDIASLQKNRRKQPFWD